MHTNENVFYFYFIAYTCAHYKILIFQIHLGGDQIEVKLEACFDKFKLVWELPISTPGLIFAGSSWRQKSIPALK